MPISYKPKPELQYADFKDLTSLIHFQSTKGKIWLGEQRVLLLQVSAMANFRREMVSTLGIERAKGFFLRMGFQSGLKDAELAWKLRPNASEYDMFLAGPQLHSLKGLVKVRPTEVDIDKECGRFYVEIEWIDSFEVEICQTDLGQMQDPVCWTLLGYACAYSSAFMGREIIFKEVSCRGCGGDKCRVIGKPAEEWDDVASFKQYFKNDPIIEELYELQSQLVSLRTNLDKQEGQYYGIGQTPAYQTVRNMMDKAAQGKVSVLLLGETGVGKEVIARSVHLRSKRAAEPFVAVNCAAIPPDLIESELFGVEKGAFTGATQSRMGRFERADKGTIFLDEVIELSPRAQASLLRVLQEGELERVGDNRTRKIDVRVIAATHEDLAEAVKAGRFRADLYYRLNVFPVAIPALRERREDIPLLVEHFLQRFHQEYDKRTLGLSDKALEACLHYSWPGNIRELENVIERGIILTDPNESISVQALFPRAPEEPQTASERVSSDGVLIQPGNGQGSWISQLLSSGLSLDEIEESLIREAMQQANQNVSGAARLLGLSRPALAYRLKKIGIEG
ncbi:sigma-54-dependent Fis family transcriptional regulator [Pseudomonas aeruginosa]|uniref:sigma-54-dependent Fis family transcriptional regulator n=1 Tax=Pseudomonas aeruginosa TaxID=287 RepID=UPI001E2C78AC|nr:sigma-54-dependent Fis family transcriptional regulator [Pseudomonas aeruginosa]MCD2922907.1 sigma-54-dependent Fis family transcriptional regulator [Pseudomonas aeruginosa]MCO2586706.1 sigma-54-dependent Fis family transcriptional regulator [Pseudomonas aeruginosa]MCO2914351.1 sigma-54-dependent Fis family transcriptional regulator [Pseudomonas aeruginosa]MCO3179483.1 sigma-54-dependent Fis family transcriptional regulator [Pseudomonas aeruginosa]HBO1270564.1 sigma-54-dependent Fis family 